jgi:hypothetical protein
MTQPCNSFLSKKVHPGGWFVTQTIHLFSRGSVRNFFRIPVNYFDFFATDLYGLLRIFTDAVILILALNFKRAGTLCGCPCICQN